MKTASYPICSRWLGECESNQKASDEEQVLCSAASHKLIGRQDSSSNRRIAHSVRLLLSALFKFLPNVVGRVILSRSPHVPLLLRWLLDSAITFAQDQFNLTVHSLAAAVQMVNNGVNRHQLFLENQHVSVHTKRLTDGHKEASNKMTDSKKLVVSICATVFAIAFVEVNAEQLAEISNDSLIVSLAVPSGRLTVEDLRCGLVWHQYLPVQSARGPKWGEVRTEQISPAHHIQVHDVMARDRTLHAQAKWRDYPFVISIQLPPDQAALKVTVSTPRPDDELPWESNWAGIILMTYPYGLFNEAMVDTVVPIDEGVVYSPRDIDPLKDPRRWNLTALHSKLSMPWWGITDGHRGVMTHVETPWDCMFSIQWVDSPKGLRTLPQVTWLASKERWAYSRQVTFRFFDRGGHVAMAKAFREYEQQRGAFRSWKDKVAANPSVARLKGALDVWSQDTLTSDLVQAIRRAGIRKCILGKPRAGDAKPGQGFEPQAVRDAVDAGYLVGVYHNHSWIQGRWVDDDPALEDAGVVGSDGQVTYTQNPWDLRGRLDRCPAAHLSIFREHAHAERGLGVNYFFTDCTTTGGAIEECYHPKHPLSRAEGAEALNQALSKVAALDMVVGSERGKWWATKSTHVFEGIETLIEYGGRYYGSGDSSHWVGPYLTNKPGFQELCLGYDFNPARRLPLFQLVYHDSVYCTRRWNQDPGRDTSLWDRHDLMNILYGTATLIFTHPEAGNVIGSPSWETSADRYLQTYRIVCGWHEKIGFDEMVDHRILTSDRMVQETRFSSGWIVVVNFSQSPWSDERGFHVAPQSFHFFNSLSKYEPTSVSDEWDN